MTMIESSSAAFKRKTAYYQVRRAQQSIASYLNYDNGDLAKYLERESFEMVAQKITDKYFFQFKDLTVYKHIVSLYVALLIMSPIIQRIPESAGFNWHSGHFLSLLRRDCSNRIRKYHFAAHKLPVTYQPRLLRDGLDKLGIYDTDFIAAIMELYRMNCRGIALRHELARQIFDPVIGVAVRVGYEFRYGGWLYRFEKHRFPQSVDLRSTWVTVHNYQIRSFEKNNHSLLKIMLSTDFMAAFKHKVNATMECRSKPDLKVQQLETHIRSFVEEAKWARSAMPQILVLRNWMASRIRPLTENFQSALVLPDRMVTEWLHRVSSQLYFRKPTFFLDRTEIEYDNYLALFSPYREE